MFEGIVDGLLKRSSTKHLVERRGHYRIPCRRAVSLLLSKNAVGGHMINLSPKGMKIRAHDRVPPKHELRLVVSGKKTPGSRFVASVDLLCKVIWCKYSKLHESYDAGLEYKPAPGVDLEYIDAFFRHELGLEDLETYQRRCSRRISTEMDMTTWTQDGKVWRGAIRDLSMEGAQFESNAQLPLGSEIRIAIDVEGRKEPIYCASRVVRCRPTSREGWYETGVSFIEVSDKDRTELKRVLQRATRDR
jgi:hypothetical protein